MSMLDNALAWAARGFRVFPLRAGTKKPIVPMTPTPSMARTTVSPVAVLMTAPIDVTSFSVTCSDRIR